MSRRQSLWIGWCCALLLGAGPLWAQRSGGRGGGSRGFGGGGRSSSSGGSSSEGSSSGGSWRRGGTRRRPPPTLEELARSSEFATEPSSLPPAQLSLHVNNRHRDGWGQPRIWWGTSAPSADIVWPGTLVYGKTFWFGLLLLFGACVSLGVAKREALGKLLSSGTGAGDPVVPTDDPFGLKGGQEMFPEGDLRPPTAPVAPVARPHSPWDLATVRVVSLGIDGRWRSRIQAAMTKAAGEIDVSTPEKIESSRQAIVQRLLEAGESVRYAYVHTEEVPTKDAESAFSRTVDRLSGAYEVETVHNTMRTGPLGITARAEEGEGFVVVSLVCGYDGLLDASAGSPQEWRAALARLRPDILSQWVALEVVCRPRKRPTG